MPSQFDAAFIDEIKRRTSLSVLIQSGASGIKLKRHGREYTGCCPFHADKRPSFSVNDEKGVYFCRSACAASGDCFTWLMQREGYSFIEAVHELGVRAGLLLDKNGHKPRKPAPIVATYDPEQEAREHAHKIAWTNAFWRTCERFPGSLGERYLNAREIFAEALPEEQWPVTLRFHPACEWIDREDGKIVRREVLPAMVAAIQAKDRTIIGTHTTWLRPDGSWKAGLVDHEGKKCDRKIRGLLVGGAVRLGYAGPSLDIAEGLETSLTVMMGMGAPVWATLSLYNMGAFEPPEHVQALTKWTDNDEGDKEFARKTISAGNERHAREGFVVQMCPAPPGHDWNSIHMEKAQAARGRAAEAAARSVA